MSNGKKASNLGKLLVVGGGCLILGAVGYKKYNDMVHKQEENTQPFATFKYKRIEVVEKEGEAVLNLYTEGNEKLEFPYDTDNLLFIVTEDTNTATISTENPNHIVRLFGTNQMYAELIISLAKVNTSLDDDDKISSLRTIRNININEDKEKQDEKNQGNLILDTIKDLNSLKTKKDLALDIYKMAKLVKKLLK